MPKKRYNAEEIIHKLRGAENLSRASTFFPRPREGFCLCGGVLELARWDPKARRGFRPSCEPL